MTMSAQRPSKRSDTETPAHVKKARDAVASDQGEKKIPLLAPVRYHKGLQEIKGMSDTPVKYLLLEAINDLFEKYARGDGHFDVGNVAELKRRLDALE
ncbi:hypothetical protein DZ956_022190 [Pseudomonas aeruginosa]|uniref:hypothetical protein n=1 Tax=Pseudomonas aeruginosa TaxID=287 RepID=UPI0011C1330F|nr:hypothetical protein [Pseudomonas aeruginosa]NPZ19488.1 hypothetical protein [Pseudomonas aeruginosa]